MSLIVMTSNSIFSWHYVQMGYDPINKLPHIQRMNSLRGDPVNLDGSKINIQDKEVTPDKIKRAVSFIQCSIHYYTIIA